MTYDPNWDPRLYEILRMPVVEILLGNDLVVGKEKVKARTLDGKTFYILREDFTTLIKLFVDKQNPDAPYMTLEQEDGSPTITTN